MSVSVALEFALPGQPDIQSISIYESDVPEGPFALIETISDVGTYPGYINNYTTEMATSVDYWFAISWMDEKGAVSELSQPVKGNTQSIVSIITERVMQRGITAIESVVIQEAEAVAEAYFGMNPYEVPLPVSYSVLSGLTYMTMARSLVSQIVSSSSGSVQSWTAGLVSMKSGDNTTIQQEFDWLVGLASNLLGINVSRIAQMICPEIAGGLAHITNLDISRLQVTEIV